MKYNHTSISKYSIIWNKQNYSLTQKRNSFFWHNGQSHKSDLELIYVTNLCETWKIITEIMWCLVQVKVTVNLKIVWRFFLFIARKPSANRVLIFVSVGRHINRALWSGDRRSIFPSPTLLFSPSSVRFRVGPPNIVGYLFIWPTC